MFPVISLGPLSLPAPQLILLLGIWLGSTLAERRVKRFGDNNEVLFKVIWGSLIAGLVGARLSFIARNPFAFQGEWMTAFSLNPALLDPFGGSLIALVAGYFIASRNGQANRDLLDNTVPFLAVLTSAIFLSNFASGTGFGKQTDLPWGVELWGSHRHPVQLYYFAASLIVLYIVVFNRSSSKTLPGENMLSYLIYTTGYLTVLLAFQDPTGNLISGLRVFQLVSWIVFTSCVFIFGRLKIKEVQNASS